MSAQPRPQQSMGRTPPPANQVRAAVPPDDDHSSGPEDRQILAISKLPRELAVIRMENDNIMALAASYPRDYAMVLEDIKSQLRAFRSFASEAMYCKPVGKDDKGQMKFARGLSIRSAEAIAAAYKYNRVRTDIVNIDPDTVRVTAMFMDYQSGRIWEDSGVLSKLYRKSAYKGGGMARHDDDRFYSVVVKAEMSKRVREVILRSVPPGLRSELEQCVDEQLDSFLDEATQKKIVGQFSSKGVTQEMLEKHLGKRMESFDKIDRGTLLGLWTALKDGEITVAEIIGEENGHATVTPGKAASVPAAGESKADKLAQNLAGGADSQSAPEPQNPPTDSPIDIPAGTPEIATAEPKSTDRNHASQPASQSGDETTLRMARFTARKYYGQLVALDQESAVTVLEQFNLNGSDLETCTDAKMLETVASALRTKVGEIQKSDKPSSKKKS